jgi:hypothetical protein
MDMEEKKLTADAAEQALPISPPRSARSWLKI